MTSRMAMGTSGVFFVFFPDFPQADPPPNSLPRNPLARACPSYAVLESIASATSRPFGVSKPPSRPARRRLPRWAGWGSSTSVAPKRVANKIQRPFRKGVRQAQKTQWPSTSRKGAAHQGSTVASSCSAALVPGTAFLSPCAMLPAPHPPVKQRGKRLSPEPKSPWR